MVYVFCSWMVDGMVKDQVYSIELFPSLYQLLRIQHQMTAQSTSNEDHQSSASHTQLADKQPSTPTV